MTIPKLIHFIYPWTEKTRPWSLINTMAVRSAMKVYPDHEIIIWTNAPTRIPMLPVEKRKCELPTHIGETEIVWPQYVSDVMRLQILHEHGGIYMDTDMISLRPFKPYDDSILSFCWETAFCNSICNAFMATPPGNEFINDWLDRMPAAMSHPTWAYGGVVVPYEMTQDPFHDAHYNALSHHFFCPLDLSKNWMFDPKLKKEAKDIMGNPCAIHIFETFWRDIIKDITPEWIEKNNCLFSELISGY
jgi:hypothetical protein